MLESSHWSHLLKYKDKRRNTLTETCCSINIKVQVGDRDAAISQPKLERRHQFNLIVYSRWQRQLNNEK